MLGKVCSGNIKPLLETFHSTVLHFSVPTKAALRQHSDCLTTPAAIADTWAPFGHHELRLWAWGVCNKHSSTQTFEGHQAIFPQLTHTPHQSVSPEALSMLQGHIRQRDVYRALVLALGFSFFTGQRGCGKRMSLISPTLK